MPRSVAPVLAALALAALAAPLANAQAGGVSVSMTPDRFDYAPGEVAAGNVSVFNGLDRDAAVTVTVTDPTGELQATLHPSGTLLVPAFGTVVVYASVNLPESVATGYHSLHVRASESGSESATSWTFRVERPVTIFSPQRPNITASFAERTVTAAPGETLTLPARVDNGDARDHDVVLLVRDASNRLSPWLSASSLRVPAGSSASVDVHVEIPADASSFYTLDLQVDVPGQEGSALARVDISAFAAPSPPTPTRPTGPTPMTAPLREPVRAGFEANPMATEARASDGRASIPVRLTSHADLAQTIRWVVDPDDASGNLNRTGETSLAARTQVETFLEYPTSGLGPGAHAATVTLFAAEDPGALHTFRIILVVPDEPASAARVEMRALFETLEAPPGGFARGDVEIANRGDGFVTVRMNGTFDAGDGGIEALTFDTPLLRLGPRSTVLVRANVTLEGDVGREDSATLRATIESGDGAAPEPIPIRARVVAPVADAPPGPLQILASAAAEHPVATAGAGAGGVAVVAAALLARRERWRWAALAPLAALYTRLRKADVLDHAMRERIHRMIVERPGIHYSALKDATRLNAGALVHHLRTLERHGLVTSRREGPLRRFYPVGQRLPEVPAHALTPMQARILAILEERPLTQKDLAARLGLTQQGVNYHVKTLERKGHLVVEREGAEWLCHRVREAAPTDAGAAT